MNYYVLVRHCILSMTRKKIPFCYISQVKVEKFAQVVHSMQALLEEEMDLVQGQVVKITEIIDKDWYRGESDGKTGTFPASFVRIIDSFPGDAPPDSADISSYLKKSQRYAYFIYCFSQNFNAIFVLLNE